MKKPLRHIFDYLVLSVIVSVAIVLILLTNGNKPTQKLIVIGLSSLYIVWGIFHHKKEGTINPEIALEYGLFATLGSLLVIGLL